VNFNNPIELNRYGYTAGNPINGSDPTGNFIWETGTIEEEVSTSSITPVATLSRLTKILLGAFSAILVWILASSNSSPNPNTTTNQNQPCQPDPTIIPEAQGAQTSPYKPDQTYTAGVLDAGVIIYRAEHAGTLKRRWYFPITSLSVAQFNQAPGTASKAVLLDINQIMDDGQTEVNEYEVIKCIPTATGQTHANPQFGKGGGVQFYVRWSDLVYIQPTGRQWKLV
jgi:hypothetical protein